MRRTRRQELTPADLRECAVWEFTLREKATGANEGELRARPELDFHDHRMLINGATVRARFRLADGSQWLGMCSPVHRLTQPAFVVRGKEPAIVTDDGQVHFCHNRQPTSEELASAYELLSRSARDVFPVTFCSDVSVAEDEIGEGVITGFSLSEYYEEKLGGGLKRPAARSGEVF